MRSPVSLYLIAECIAYVLSCRLALPELCCEIIENTTETFLFAKMVVLSSKEAPLYAAAAVVLSLRKVPVTYGLIVIPDGIRHICLHFLCTLK